MALSRRRELAVLAGILVVYALSLGRAVTYDFVWDDVHELQTNPAFDGPLLDGLRLTQTERTDPDLTQLRTIELAYDSYRPLLFASYWLDIRLFGRSPVALHLVSLLLGAIAIGLAHLVARSWLDPPLALITTAIFALHPVQIEAVAYISGRGDLLAGVLALAATLAARRALDAERPAGWTVLAAVAFAGSLLAKEAYLGLPIAITALAWCAGRLRARWWVPGSLVVVIAAYLALRAAMVTPTTGAAAAAAFAALPGIVLEYARILVLPFDLSTQRMLEPAYAIPGWIAATAALGLLAWRGARARPAVAGVAWMVALLAPSALAIASQRVVADRYAYLATLGAAIAVVWTGAQLIRRAPRLRLLFAAGAILWGLLALVVSWRQVPVWRDNVSLYTNAAEMAPGSSSAQYRLGVLDAAAGRWDDALARFEAAIELEPTNVLAHNNLGVGRLRRGDFAGASAALSRAVELAPAHFRAWYNLGLARLGGGDRSGGCAAVRRALEINPRYEPALAETTSASGRCSP